MIQFFAKARSARCVPQCPDKITTGSVGIQVLFSLSEEWEGLAKTAVFRGGGHKVDVLLLSDRCEVPPEVLEVPGGDLSIGLYGTGSGGAVVIPTVWASAGRIYLGAEPSGIEPSPQTQSLVDQILEAAQAAQDAAEDAEETAQSVRDDADAGEFDGEDGNCIWWTTDAIAIGGANVYYTQERNVQGRAGATPQAKDLLVGPDPGTAGPVSYLYSVRGIQNTYVYLDGIGSIKGDRGQQGPAGPAGSQGQRGEQGPAGPSGEDGYSPTVTVTEISGGHRVTITDEDGDHVFDVMDGSGGGGGTSDYDDLTDKPQINSVTLSGNKTAADLGLEEAGVEDRIALISASDVPLERLNGYINSDGTVTGTTSLYFHSFIDVAAGERYKITGLSAATNVVLVGLYDAEDNFTVVKRGTGTITDEVTVEVSISTDGRLAVSGVGAAFSETSVEKISYYDERIDQLVDYTYDAYDELISGKVDWRFLLDNVLCIGDSLTLGVPANTSSMPSPLQQNYPWYLSRMTGAKCTNAGVGGISTKDWYHNYYSQYSMPDYNAAIILLGTNGGLTDTLETDVEPYDDYQDYADTNTGCYCALIEHIRADNPNIMIVLVNIWSVASTGQTTRDVIDKIGAKYDLLVVDTYDLRYAVDPSLHAGYDNVHMAKSGYLALAHRICLRLKDWYAKNKAGINLGMTLAANDPDYATKQWVLDQNYLGPTALGPYRTAAAQDTIDAAQDTAIAGKLSTTGNAYRAASIPMGELDSTSTATVMTATVDGITELRDGVCVWLRNGVIASASGVTLNINSLGAKPIYNSLSGAVVTTTFVVASTYLFVYNSTRVTGGCWDMVYGYDTNTTYTPVKLGFGYATCSTAEATTAKTASLSSYTLTTGGIVAIKFTNAVPAGATLNVNSKGAKAIYYKGAAITAGVIKAGDTVTMIYSTYYHVLAIDRDETGGGGGTSDYTQLSNKPSINNVTLSGNQSAADLGLAPAGAYVKPSGGIPKTDLAAAVQTSLGKADTALQSYTETDPTVPSWAKQSSKPAYTASEVGAIAAPASPATGAFLVWNGSAWTAQTLATWQGGNY